MTVISQYTVRVNFTITNGTKRCKIHCYSTNHLETRTLHITNAVVNSDNASMNESTLALTPTPTRTVVQTTRSFTYPTSPLYIQPTITTNITEISSEHQATAGINNNNNNHNNNNNDNSINNSNGMIIALLPLVVILLIVAVLNLMFTIKNCKRQDQKC